MGKIEKKSFVSVVSWSLQIGDSNVNEWFGVWYFLDSLWWFVKGVWGVPKMGREGKKWKKWRKVRNERGNKSSVRYSSSREGVNFHWRWGATFFLCLAFPDFQLNFQLFLETVSWHLRLERCPRPSLSSIFNIEYSKIIIEKKNRFWNK